MRNVKVNYDAANDILYLSFGDPRPSYAEEYQDGVYVRFDMKTDELSGITILDFSKRSEELKQIKFPGEVTFEQMNDMLH